MAKSQQESRLLKCHRDWIHGLEFLADGRSLLSCANDATLIWRIADSQIIGRRMHYYRWAISPDRQLVAATLVDNAVELLRADDGQCVRTLRTPSSVLHPLWTPDGKYVVAWCSDGAVRFFEPTEGIVCWQHSPIEGLMFSADGNLVSLCCFEPGNIEHKSVQVWKLRTRMMLRRMPFETRDMFYPYLSPCGRTLLIRRDGVYSIRAVASYDSALEAEIGDKLPYLSPDWSTYALIDESAGAVEVWSRAQKRMLCGVGPFYGRVVHIEFAPDSRSLVCQDEFGNARLCRVRDGENLVTLTGASYPWPIFTANGEYGAICLNPDTVHVYHTRDGSLAHVYQARKTNVGRMALTADGAVVAIGGANGVVEVW